MLPDEKKEGTGSEELPAYEEAEMLEQTMMDINLKDLQQKVAAKPAPPKAAPKEDSVDDLLKKQKKSLLSRLGLGFLSKK